MNLQYEIIKAALNARLVSEGYNVTKERYDPDVFGSRYTIWSSGNSGKRLIWDGKDRWFILQESNAITFDWQTDWKELIHVPYNSEEHDGHYADGIVLKILEC